MKKTGNKPFIFRFIIENDRKVSELIERQKKYYGSNKPVRKQVESSDKTKQVESSDKTKKWADHSIENELDVITDFEHFDLNLTYTSELTQVKNK